MGLNIFIGTGNLASDPSLKATQNGKEMCTFRLAVNSSYGENKKTSFLHIITFGKTATNCNRFLAKGRKVAIRGRIETGSYEKSDGTKVYTTDIIADEVEFLPNGDAPSDAPKQTTEEVAQQEGFEKLLGSDDVPFN